ncbi:MAG TPA: LysR family transcriptional regulator, partial [Ramlibacter sp.]|nr:LysR family transcriptional regulator [Ramlibacter sp.]
MRAFIHVVEEGSIGRAAERLCITQPALSRTIKRLENSVGDALFERHAVGMRLTSVGMALLPHAQLLNREEQLAREEIMAMRGLAAGTLRLGVTSSTSAVMLPALVAKFWKRWPDLKIEAIEGVREELSLALKNYKVDLILAAAAPDSDEVIAIKDCRWTEEVSVVAGQSHPLVQVREPLTLEQLRSYRWGFVPRATEPYERFVQIF